MLIERGYFAALRELIEQMYRENGNTKITLIVDSQGGPVSHYFLTNLVTQEWKDTYIGTYMYQWQLYFLLEVISYTSCSLDQ